MRFMCLKASPPNRNFLALDVAERCPPGNPTAGDTRFEIRLRFGVTRDQNFYARTHAWVALRSLRSFVQALESLERDRRGSAGFESMSPNEFNFVITIFSPAGHVMVRGQTGRHLYGRGQDMLWVCLPFEIE